MSMARFKTLIFFLSLTWMISCATEPELESGEYQPKIVIDGWIESGNFPKVMLTSSLSYFASIDSVTIRKLVITTAKITVSDGTQEEILTLKKDDNYFPPYIYSGTDIRGEVGKTYTLTVESKGMKYTAQTTIPPPASFDSLWFQAVPGKDSLGYIYGKFADDPGVENFYRVFTERENKDKRFVPVYLSAIGDQSFNGKSFTFSLLRGPDSFSKVVDDLYFVSGDTVRIKFCTMDKSSFDFWRTLERELYVVGNPFSSSGNEIKSNIDGSRALGVWGGYGVNYYTLITKK
jgi:hypothetical protein